MVVKFFIYFGLYFTLPHDRIEEIDDTPGRLPPTVVRVGKLLLECIVVMDTVKEICTACSCQMPTDRA